MTKADVQLNPWHPMTDTVDLKHLLKLVEELNECGTASARCMMQGIDEAEPVTGKVNREWLQDELADVWANMELVIEHFGLDFTEIYTRRNAKKYRLKEWYKMA